MKRLAKMNNIVVNAIQLRNQILGNGLTSDEELSEELQLAFEDVSLAIVQLTLRIDNELGQ